MCQPLLLLLFVAVSYAQQCPPGTMISGSGCTPCPLGAYSNIDDATTCTWCSFGTASLWDQAIRCVACPAGYYAVSFSGYNDCKVCTPFSYSPGYDSSVCYQCTAGSYAIKDKCLECNPGTYSLAGASACKSCGPEGGYNIVSRMSTCTTCAPGTYTEFTYAGFIIPTRGCTACTAGKYSTGSGATSPCVLCSAGSYAISATACEACPAGRYAPQQGECTACAAGTYSSTLSATACAQCDAGTYNSFPSASFCTACAAGTYSTALAREDECPSCPPGYAVSGLLGCQPCEAGSAGSASCSGCSTGSYAAYSGATACVDCPPFTAGSPQHPRNASTHCRCLSGYACRYTTRSVTVWMRSDAASTEQMLAAADAVVSG